MKYELHGESQTPGIKSKLGFLDREIYEDRDDLVALKPPADRDFLSRVLRDHWPNSLRSQPGITTYHYEERRVVWLVGLLSTLVASVLLVVSILTLFWVQDSYKRLALVLTFIIIFAISLKLCTGASRDQIFGATAAYSAVLVVFVSGNLANSPG